MCNNTVDLVLESLGELRWLYFGMVPIFTCNLIRENVAWNRNVWLTKGDLLQTLTWWFAPRMSFDCFDIAGSGTSMYPCP